MEHTESSEIPGGEEVDSCQETSVHLSGGMDGRDLCFSESEGEIFGGYPHLGTEKPAYHVWFASSF